MNEPWGLSEVSQTKTNTVWFHLHEESKNQNRLTNKAKKETDSQTQRSNFWLLAVGGGEGWTGEMSEGD